MVIPTLRIHSCLWCNGSGSVILGYAYPVGGVLPIVDDPDSVGEDACVQVEEGVIWHWKAGEPDEYAETEITDALAHYGDPAALVGQYALQIAVTQSVGP